MDNDKCYASDIACCNDSRIVHWNTSDSYIDSGTDTDIHSENFGCICMYSVIVSMDRSENARNDA